LTIGGKSLFSTNLNLTGGDSLSASANSNTVVLEKDKNWFTGQIYYRGILPGDAPTTSITVALTRPNDTDAPNSVMSIPYSPDLTAPINTQVFTQSENFTINWDNNNSTLPVTLEFNFRCTLEAGTSAFGVEKSSIANTGSISYSISSLLGSNLTLKNSETCSTKITISREKAGTLDPNYGEGGTITAKQHRSVTVTVNP